MNSEELEQSLRTEFENYLNEVFAGFKQEFSQFQEKIETEFDKHKSQLDGIINEFSARVPTEKELDDVFKETVVEHLRLARDEGARITATAIAEAEKMEKEAAPSAGIPELRDAISDITDQTSQAAILKTLVNHAAQFTPRGAFFIIKNEHFVGWRVFGDEGGADEDAIREIYFPVAASTILGESVRSLSAVESSYGTYAGDSIYLNKLDFGQPSRMFAIPLVVRGRGVAVLYADYGTKGESVNIEALESLVQIAGLTVELLAASQGGRSSRETRQTNDYGRESSADHRVESRKDYEQTTDQPEQTEAAEEFQSQSQNQSFAYEKPAAEEYQSSAADAKTVESESAADYFKAAGSGADAESAANEYASEDYYAAEDKQPESSFESYDSSSWNQSEAGEENYSWNRQTESFGENAPSYSDEAEIQDASDAFQPSSAEQDYSAPSAANYQFDETPSPFETSPLEDSRFEPTETSQPQSADNFASAAESFGSYESGKTETSSHEPAQAVSQSAAAMPVKSRFSDRNVDLPIEVSEDERRLHNDARRFARLLISEIKLYNEQKVKEGREANDLYERLREAIDRSREMYDKRVQPPVAAKFDYFHYELVNSLAEGEENKLGQDYPGAAV